MPRPKKSDTPISGELPKPDYERAKRIYMNDILPAASKRATHDQELSSAHKEVKKVAHVHGGAFKAVIKLKTMEFDSQQAFLRDFKGLCEEFGIGLERTLFDVAESDDSQDGFIPTIASGVEEMATLN